VEMFVLKRDDFLEVLDQQPTLALDVMRNFSARRMFVANIALATVTAGALAMVPPYPVLVLLRFLQGVGTGALLPLLLMSVLRFTPLP